MSPRLAAACLLAAAALFAAPATGGEETAGRMYPLRDQEKLRLEVPASWSQEIRRDAKNAPPTILFKTESAGSFLILLTVILPSGETFRSSSDEAIRKQVERSAMEAAPISVEKRLEVVEIRGESGRGWYFFATDPSPGPGKWKYLTQGILRIGELAVSFTVLTNDGQKGVIDQAMRMLRRAKHVKFFT